MLAYVQKSQLSDYLEPDKLISQRNDTLGPKSEQISTKWDKSGTFKRSVCSTF